MGFATKALLSSLNALVPIGLPFNILFCLPALIIPLGVTPKITSIASLAEKDLVTTKDQLSDNPKEPLLLTQRDGKYYLVEAVVPSENFRIFSKFKGVSITGALQTMINVMYEDFENSKAILISSFGVAGLDGLLRIQEAQIKDGYQQLDPSKSTDMIHLNFKLSIKPPEKEEKGEKPPIAGAGLLNSINTFMP